MSEPRVDGRLLPPASSMSVAGPGGGAPAPRLVHPEGPRLPAAPVDPSSGKRSAEQDMEAVEPQKKRRTDAFEDRKQAMGSSCADGKSEVPDRRVAAHAILVRGLMHSARDTLRAQFREDPALSCLTWAGKPRIPVQDRAQALALVNLAAHRLLACVVTNSDEISLSGFDLRPLTLLGLDLGDLTSDMWAALGMASGVPIRKLWSGLTPLGHEWVPFAAKGLPHLDDVGVRLSADAAAWPAVGACIDVLGMARGDGSMPLLSIGIAYGRHEQLPPLSLRVPVGARLGFDIRDERMSKATVQYCERRPDGDWVVVEERSVQDWMYAPRVRIPESGVLNQHEKAQARKALCAALRTLLGPGSGSQPLEHAADWLLACIMPGRKLQVGMDRHTGNGVVRSEPSLMKMVHQMPLAAWQVLDGLGITFLSLPVDEGTDVAALCQRAMQIRALQRLELDLEPVQPSVDPHSRYRPSALCAEVTRRSDVEVMAYNFKGAPSTRPSLLRTRDEKGQLAQAVALPGVPYYTAGIDKRCLNGEIRFAPPRNVARAASPPAIFCRHMAAHLLDTAMEKARQLLRSGAPAGSSDFNRQLSSWLADFRSGPAMQAAIRPQVEQRFRDMARAGAQAVVQFDTVPLRLLFEQTPLGEVRGFMVVTGDHAFCLFVLRGQQCVLIAYEPNRSRTLAVLAQATPSDFDEEFNLGTLLALGEKDHVTAAARLYEWAPTFKPLTGAPKIFMKDDDDGDLAHFEFQLAAGSEAQFPYRVLRAVLAGELDDDRPSLVSRFADGYRGLLRADAGGDVDVMQAVLRSGLGVDEKMTILSMEAPLDALDGRSFYRTNMTSPLFEILAQGSVVKAAHYGRELSEASDEELPHADRLKLLHGPNRRTPEVLEHEGGRLEVTEFHVDAVHDVCDATGLWEFTPALRHNQHLGLYAYLSAVLRSRAWSPFEKAGILAAVFKGRTAFEAALASDNAGAAAAIVCAILDSDAPPNIKRGWLSLMMPKGQDPEKQLKQGLEKEPKPRADEWRRKLDLGFEALKKNVNVLDAKAPGGFVSEAAAAAVPMPDTKFERDGKAHDSVPQGRWAPDLSPARVRMQRNFDDALALKRQMEVVTDKGDTLVVVPERIAQDGKGFHATRVADGAAVEFRLENLQDAYLRGGRGPRPPSPGALSS